jgi:hypothetical protein
MTAYYTVNEMYGEKFYQVPKVFFTNPLYKKGLSPLEKMAFGLLKDRFSLSVKNGWYDDRGRIYFIFTQENLMEIFDCSKQTASNIKKNLVKVGLLEVKKRGQGKTDLLYLKKPIVTDIDIYEIDKAETVGAVEKSKNETSRSAENRPLEVPKIDGNDTDFNDTDSIDTNKNLNPNPNEENIYSVLWDTKIPSRLKIRIKILLQNQSINLSPEQILLIEDAYLYQIRKSYVVPDCSADDITALNDYEFSATVEKMLKTVKKIDNIRGLIKSWVQTAFDYKCCEQYVGDFSSNQTDPKFPFYDWLND